MKENRKNSNQQMLDAALALAAGERAAEIARRAVEDSGETYTFSPRFEQRMDRLLRGARAWERARRAANGAGKVAAVFAACVAVSAAVVVNVDALRIPVLNFFIDAQEKSTSMRIGAEDPADANVPEEYRAYLPHYMPEGFVITDTHPHKSGCVFTFTMGEDIIMYDVWIDPQFMAFDTEDAEVTETEINGYRAFIIVEGDETMIEMFSEEIKFGLSGNIDQETALEIMQSIDS